MLRIGNQELKEVNCYRYLGLIFTHDGNWDEEYQARMAKASEVQARMRHLFAERNIPPRLRWEIWCAVIRSRLEYGCEVAIFSTTQMKAMERFQRDAMRLILGCNIRTAKVAVEGDLAAEKLGGRFSRFRVRLWQEISQADSRLTLHRGVWGLESRRFPRRTF